MKTLSTFRLKNIWSMSIVFVVVLSAFLLLPWHEAKAGDAGEYVYFRIDTELDVLNGKGVTIRWYCTGATSFGQITDGDASESAGGIADVGTIRVASASKEMQDASCDFGGAADTLRASVSLDGWVTREWTETFPIASGTAVFTTRASMDYAVVVNGVDDQLGSELQLDGSVASASYSAAYASQSYSNYLPLGAGTWKKYIAATASGTVTAEKDGYVKATSDTITGFSADASRSVDFTTDYDSDVDHAGLLFAVKVTVNGTTRFGESVSGGTGRTVSAGDNSATACTNGGSNDYYCAVLLAQSTGLTATSDAFRGLGLTLTCNYTDRSAEADGQTSCTINATDNPGVGDGGGGSTYTYETTPTPSPEVTPTPTPEPGLSPTPTPTPVSTTLYRKASDPKVYVQGSDGTLSWVKTLADFNAAGYKWSDVKTISGSEFAQMKVSEGTALVTAALFRKANDPKVYVQGSDGTLSWVKTIEAFNAAGYSWSNVKLISGTEFAAMRVGGNMRIAKGIAFLRVRSGPSTTNKVVGQVLPGQELKFTEIKNGWYHIDSGWISGAYAKEF